MTHVQQARRYEAQVIAGKIPACKWVRLACERNRRDLDRAQTDAFPYTFNSEAAERVCEAVEQLPHIKGDHAKPVFIDGQPQYPKIRLEPWQCWIITTIFGWLRADGRRRFRTAIVMVPRKNGKSTMLGAVGLFMITADGEPGAEGVSAATTRDQAKIVAEAAWEMASRATDFREYFGVRIGAKTSRKIEVPATASSFAPLSADAHTLDGLNIHFGGVDELHAHRTRQVWDVLETATGARSQPLIWAISTAGSDRTGICYEQITYLRKLLDRTLTDETYFGIEYTIDEEDQWDAESSFIKANPNYGVSVMPDDLRRKADKARHSPASVNNFLTKHLNVWVSAEATWMPMDRWLALGDDSLEPEHFAQYPCWLGVDLAEVRDMAAVVLIFKTAPDQVVVFGRYYWPELTAAQSPIAQLSGWIREGDLIQTDGDNADYQRIEDDIFDLCKKFKVQKVCFDRALAAQMGQQLVKRLGPRPEVLTVNQSVDVMNPAMQMCERMVLGGKLRHDANPVLAWMFSNVVVARNHKDEIFPRKAGGKDSANKIDGAVAFLTAIGQVMAEQPTARYGGFVV